MKTLTVLTLLAPVAGLFLLGRGHQPAGQGVVVASKSFTESVILGEILTQASRAEDVPVQHRAQLGGTRILYSALLSGDIDLYPEYTGTIVREILAEEIPADKNDGNDLTTVRKILATHGLQMSQPLGFNNTYALGTTRKSAEQLGLEKISDLNRHAGLRLGFTNEFMDRADGWPGLRDTYSLSHKNVTGLDHDLAYQALESRSIDVTDLYSTDAKIAKYDLAVLLDDAGHFPRYDAVILFRSDLETRFPRAVDAIRRLETSINHETMIGMNADAELHGSPEGRVAADFLEKHLGVTTTPHVESAIEKILRHTREHLVLVFLSLGAAIILSIPLGIWTAHRKTSGQAVLGTIGIIQTIPALALLVFLMKPLSELAQSFPALQDWGVSGIGNAPAILALFLYSLLPIVRNTATGISQISPELIESSDALGLGPAARLRLIELPLASPTILAGIKTAAVVNVGFATLGALIGAGGLGQPILTGIRLNDYALIMQGAAPAAALALLVQAWFELAERAFVPQGLQLGTGR